MRLLYIFTAYMYTYINWYSIASNSALVPIPFQQCFIPATKQDRCLIVEDSHAVYIA